MAYMDGNGWVTCGLGHRHWGRFGAAGLLAFVPDGPVLLQRRTWWSHHGGTWGLPGGARDSHEAAFAAAMREAAEECGVPADAGQLRGIFDDDHGGWSYQTVLLETEKPFAVHAASDETSDAAWVDVGDVTARSLHPGFAEHWAELRAALHRLTVIVDGANVVGSRPDGWWRDRAGAAVRLRDQLEPLARDGIDRLPDAPAEPVRPHAAILRMTRLPDIVLVVEGAARPAADSSRGGRVRVVAARGSGDDTIAELAAKTPGQRVVVTADRELRRRCVDAGASVAGPGWLLDLL
jgi:8-oxo-dGTP pyrophosphatase MutT (NUDIX family)